MRIRRASLGTTLLIAGLVAVLFTILLIPHRTGIWTDPAVSTQVAPEEVDRGLIK
ncbi:hypothetical protein [Mycoplana dimorpha]|uniref:hypothetical protein n=1 Tax=Mycoplana dimorpha TaxID=28320 RepID=UPI001473EA04|nr:hypothetical protein [Mycoplana dimorpha]